MTSYLHLSFICSQDEDYANNEKNFNIQVNFQLVSLDLTIRIPLQREFKPCEDNIDVGEKEVNEGSDVRIVGPSTKPINKKIDAVGKKKAPATSRTTKVKVEGEEDRRRKK